MLSERRNLIILGAVVVGVLGLGYLLYLSVRPTPPIEGINQVPRPPRGHDNALVFETGGLPPPGGQHFDIWQNCGIYTEPIETGNAIHSLEHGAVWVTYAPDLPADEVARLQDKVRGDPFLLLSPYLEQTSPIALTAWGYQLTVDSAGDGRIDQFIERYRLGPQTPEPGATCNNGVGTPQ